MPTASVVLPAGPSAVDYAIAGSGPTLVLVHGTATSADFWAPYAATVADRYTVVTPNLSGSGATTDPGGPLTVADYAAQVVAVAEDAVDGAPPGGPVPVHLVGWSLGAVVAAHVAATRPDLVRSLVLVSGWSATDARGHALFDLWAAALGVGPELFTRLLMTTGAGPAFYDALGRDGLDQVIASLAELVPAGTDRQIAVDHAVDVTGLLGAVTAPTLVVGCARDQMIPVEHQRAQASAITGARYIELDAGHILPIELPELFAATVTGFLDQQPSPVR
jgi:pimeloyl-ACP methyl ester carboxylesterase